MASSRLSLFAPLILAAGCACCTSDEGEPGGAASAPTQAGGLPDARLAGTWSGRGRVLVAWCETPEIPVTLTFAPDGGVSGRVGDAILRDAHVRSNRGAVARSLGLFCDWLVTAGLQGALVEDEGIRRDEVQLALDWQDGRLSCAVHSSGSTFGGHDTMTFTAVAEGLELQAGVPASR
jgi:hypothetical protein